MKLIHILVAALTLSACEKYTDATSPCFGKTGEPVVSRNAATPLSFIEPVETMKNCDFQPLGNGS